jgi:hypothetical protein
MDCNCCEDVVGKTVSTAKVPSNGLVPDVTCELMNDSICSRFLFIIGTKAVATDFPICSAEGCPVVDKTIEERFLIDTIYIYFRTRNFF